jgi:hypothetical protein
MGVPIERDELLVMLRALPGVEMEPGFARRTRERALTVLSRRQKPAARLFDAVAAYYSRFLEPALVGVLSVGFLLWVVARCAETLSRGPGLFF